MVTVEQIGKKYIARCTFAEKEIPKAAGFRWDPQGRCWWTEDSAIAVRLMDPVKAEAMMVEVREREAAKTASITQSRKADADIDVPRPEGLEYLPYQRAGIAYALQRRNTLFGDDMGLGKTIQAIGFINSDSELRKILIVCPASLRLNWQREIMKWLVPRLRIGFAVGTFCHPEVADITIINYDILWKHHKTLRQTEWDLVVCDEAHLMKNPKTKRTRAICGIDDYHARKEEIEPLEPLKSRRALFLTGTPLPNRVVEGWPLFHYLAPDEFKSFYSFNRRYCEEGRLGELQEKLRATIMVRRLKGDVMKELPAKRRQIIEFSDPNNDAVLAEREAWEAHEDEIENLRAAAELAKASEDEDEYKRAVNALTSAVRVAFTEISKLRHETALSKIPFVLDHLRSYFDEGRKVIVFAHHHDVIEAITGEFGDQAVSVYGPTPMPDRQAAVDRFQNDPACLVIVGGFGPMGVGWTLTAGSVVVFAELDWVPGNMTQAEDRAHRIGQTDMVLAQHLVLEGSLDARMAAVLVEKQEIQAAALDNFASQQAVAPAKEKAATEGATRAKITAEAEKMTLGRIAAIHEALQILAGMCDGARNLDGAGFSKIDAGIGHSLAQCSRLSARQAALGAQLVRKYRRQLPGSLTEAALEA